MSTSPAVTPVAVSTHLFMWAAFVFVAAAGVSLCPLSEQTNDFFAWTIKPPITADFLAVTTALAPGLRDSDWPLVRIAVWVVATEGPGSNISICRAAA